MSSTAETGAGSPPALYKLEAGRFAEYRRELATRLIVGDTVVVACLPPSGHLIYAQGGSLMAVPFDSQRLQVTGTAIPVAEGILQSTANGDAQFSFSATGSLDYFGGRSVGPKQTGVGQSQRERTALGCFSAPPTLHRDFPPTVGE